MNDTVDINKMFVNIRPIVKGIYYDQVLRIQLALLKEMALSHKLASCGTVFITTTGESVMEGTYCIEIRSENRLLVRFQNPDKKSKWDVLGSDLLFEVFTQQQINTMMSNSFSG